LPAPVISQVGNAFGQGPIAPNTWVAVLGTNLSPADIRTWQGTDFANSQLPSQLDGVSVTVNGKAAYLFYVSPTQINILTPPDTLPSGSVPVQVSVGNVKSNVMMVPAQAQSLSFFGVPYSVNGLTYVIARHASDNTFIGPPNLYAGVGTTPAKPGENI